jgi:hydroxyethylthiazole kinase-like uncharacterized protein yjeF
MMKNYYKNWIEKFPWPSKASNKYSRGSVLIIGGEKHSTGAARIAAHAAARMTAGMVTIACSHESLDIYATTCQSVMARPFANAIALRNLIEEKKINAALIGPGLEVEQKTIDLIKFLKAMNLPLVIDASGLSSLATITNDLNDIFDNRTIITPHEGEFERLFGRLTDRSNDVHRISKQFPGLTLLLKGYETLICCNDELIINDHSHPSLSTAGSGDALAGMIVSLMASGTSPLLAAQIACYLHGQIGIDFGFGLTADDLVMRIPQAIAKLL